MIGSLGWQELLIILVILALLFGASRVASLGGALGKGIREFRREAKHEGESPETTTSTSATGDTTPAETRARSADEGSSSTG